MSQKSWATEAETALLISLRPSFLEHQKCRTLTKFWASLNTEFFQRFPERVKLFGPDISDSMLSEEQRTALGEAIKKRQSQLKTWFNWRCPNNARKVARITPITMESLGMKPKHRVLKEREEYSRRFYKDRIESHIKAALEREKPTRHESLNVINRVTDEWFEQEEDWVRKQVLDAIEASKKQSDEKSCGSDTERSPRQYQQAINDMPIILKQVFSELAADSGVMTNVMDTFIEHLKAVYPSDVQRHRALDLSDESAADSLPSVAGPSSAGTGRVATPELHPLHGMSTEDSRRASGDNFSETPAVPPCPSEHASPFPPSLPALSRSPSPLLPSLSLPSSSEFVASLTGLPQSPIPMPQIPHPSLSNVMNTSGYASSNFDLAGHVSTTSVENDVLLQVPLNGWGAAWLLPSGLGGEQIPWPDFDVGTWTPDTTNWVINELGAGPLDLVDSAAPAAISGAWGHVDGVPLQPNQGSRLGDASDTGNMVSGAHEPGPHIATSPTDIANLGMLSVVQDRPIVLPATSDTASSSMFRLPVPPPAYVIPVHTLTAAAINTSSRTSSDAVSVPADVVQSGIDASAERDALRHSEVHSAPIIQPVPVSAVPTIVQPADHVAPVHSINTFSPPSVDLDGTATSAVPSSTSTSTSCSSSPIDLDGTATSTAPSASNSCSSLARPSRTCKLPPTADSIWEPTAAQARRLGISTMESDSAKPKRKSAKENKVEMGEGNDGVKRRRR
ncbi:hypothetical protein BKA93DRAFT_829058 [Sparassis latifolia]